jgi:radical SAM protein with 4Fe4S-binding SPASM domain
MIDMNKTFCMAPWTHMNIGPNGDVYPCCMMPVCDTEGVNVGENNEVSDNDTEENVEEVTPLKIVSTECDGAPQRF